MPFLKAYMQSGYFTDWEPYWLYTVWSTAGSLAYRDDLIGAFAWSRTPGVHQLIAASNHDTQVWTVDEAVYVRTRVGCSEKQTEQLGVSPLSIFYLSKQYSL